MGIFGSRNDEKDSVEAVGTPELDDNSLLHRSSNSVVGKLMDIGIDGLGPLDSAADLVREKLKEHDGDAEKAIAAIRRSHVRKAAAGGFVTGVGGLLTMAVALPANIIEFYVLATRMVSSTATLRGYDIDRPEVRSAVLLTLIGADSEDLLKKAGVTSGGRLAQVAIQRLPRAAIMVINKGVGFRIATRLGAKTLSRLPRAVPLAGGFVGAGLDGYAMRRIAGQATKEFPHRSQVEPVAS